MTPQGFCPKHCNNTAISVVLSKCSQSVWSKRCSLNVCVGLSLWTHQAPSTQNTRGGGVEEILLSVFRYLFHFYIYFKFLKVILSFSINKIKVLTNQQYFKYSIGNLLKTQLNFRII